MRVCDSCHSLLSTLSKRNGINNKSIGNSSYSSFSATSIRELFKSIDDRSNEAIDNGIHFKLKDDNTEQYRTDPEISMYVDHTMDSILVSIYTNMYRPALTPSSV